MLKYLIKYIHGGYKNVLCHEALAHEGLFIFRNASGQAILAVPIVNIAYVKLDEN